MSADCALTMQTERQRQALSKIVARLILVIFMTVGVRQRYNFRKTGDSAVRISDLFCVTESSHFRQLNLAAVDSGILSS